MKKPIYTDLNFKKSAFVLDPNAMNGSFLILIALLFLFTNQAQSQCTMVCNDDLNITLPSTCEAEIRYDMILEDPDNPNICTPNGVWSYQVIVMQVPGGEPIPTSPVVTSDYVGQTLYVKVKHWSSGNSCWSTINVEDKQSPILSCPTDVLLNCTDSTDPSFTGFATASDCSDFTLTYTDNFEDLDCGLITARITRTWIATDEYNNFRTCEQRININKPHVSQVVFAPDRDGIEAPTVSCVDADTSPENTGFPTIYGQPITNGGVCNMVVDYEDQIIYGCEGSYKILRDWRVVDWCTATILEETQLIKVEDNTAPSVICTTTLTVGTTAFQECSANIVLPPAVVTDACSSTITINTSSSFGSTGENGGFLTNIPVGIHAVTYTAQDACGNVGTCDVIITVEDDDAPTAICEDVTISTLNPQGLAAIFAETFDDGSHDNCCLETFEAKRMEEADSGFRNRIEFNCDDIDVDVRIILRVSDCNGNSSDCMTVVNIDDKTPATISCPPTVTLTCQDLNQDPNSTGQPTAFDACGLGEVTFSDQEFLNDCNLGFIERTFTVSDIYDNPPTSCTQRINLIDNTPVSVSFPPDYTTSNCTSASDLEPDDLPAPFNRPTVTGDDCELVAVEVTDEIFTIAPPACFKILRTWKVIDWCTYNVNNPNGPGRYEHVQVIKVLDNDAPTFTCPDDFTVDILDDNCRAAFDLPDPTNIDDCSDNTSIQYSSNIGNGNSFTNIPEGVYDVTYNVFDGCGNASSCDITVTVQDGKAPTPYCHAGLAITLMETGMVDVWATDFDAGSFDNCTSQENLIFRLGGDSEAGDPVPSTQSLTFMCEDLGTNTVSLWAGDEAGNWAYCETFIIIQDHSNTCTFTEPGTGMLAGRISDEMGGMVEDVSVRMNGSNSGSMMTGVNGEFEFIDLDLGQDYSVTPEKDLNLRNGVTTFDQILILKHTIGTRILDSPYKIIAADVNNSGTVTASDMLEMRKVILNVSDEFENNTSWRFVDASYQFLNPLNPLTESFPEFYNLNDLANSRMNLDFIAVKVGDLNNTAIPNNLVQSDDRSNNGTLAFEIENQNLVAGQTYRIDINAQNYKDILGYQWTLQFDNEALDFIDFQTAALSKMTHNNFGWQQLDAGLISTSYAQANEESVEDGTALFTLQFKAKTNGQLKDYLYLNSDVMSAEAYDASLETLDVTLQFKDKNTAINEAFTLYQNHPNPFTNVTHIDFSLPHSAAATLTVYDVSGQVIKVMQGEFQAGQNRFTLSKSDLKRTGTLFYRLETPEYTASKRMILIE